MSIKKLCICLTLFLSLTIPGMAEEIEYNLIKKDGKIEIRKLEPVIQATVKIDAERQVAANQAFRLLFQYISGENETNQKIPMTSPVSQKTTPDQKWIISFYLPKSFSLSNTPFPTNSSVKIKKVESHKIAVIRFSGSSNQKNLDKHSKILLDYLKKGSVDHDPTPIYSFYNPPFIPPFLRRNEVAFRLLKP